MAKMLKCVCCDGGARQFALAWLDEDEPPRCSHCTLCARFTHRRQDRLNTKFSFARLRVRIINRLIQWLQRRKGYSRTP
jgi:hypothetical protein